MGKTKTKALLDLPCKFGSLSINTKTASMGVTIDRERISNDDAIEHLCYRRLTGWLQSSGNDHPDQGTLPGMEPERFQGIFDTSSVSFKLATIGCTLTLALPEVDVADLAKFASRTGKLVVSESEERDEGDSEEPEDKE